MDEIKETLTCPICQELLEDARTLPCQHVVCKTCIELWVRKKGKLICPECRYETELTVEGISELPSNFKTNNMVETFKRLESKDAASPDPAKSSITTSGKTHEHICGAVISCSIQICSSEGKIIKEIESECVSATLSFKDVKCNLAATENQGRLKLSFLPVKCGVYKLEARIDGVNITNSPLDIVVHPTGHLLSFIKGAIRQPRDVLTCGDSFLLSECSNGSYIRIDQLGHFMGSVSGVQQVDDKKMSPFGIAQAKDNTVYIADSAGNRVSIFQNNHYTGSFGEQQLQNPTGIAVGKDDLIYVASQGNGAITIYGKYLDYIRTINIEKSRKLNSKPSLAGVALNYEEDKLVVADQGNCCLFIINILQAKVERMITTLGAKTIKAVPTGVTVDDDGNIYATVKYPSPSKRLGSGAENYEGVSSKGVVLMYNHEGFYLGRFGASELISPGGICVFKKAQQLSVLVVEMKGTGYGTRAPGLKVFNVSDTSMES